MKTYVATAIAADDAQAIELLSASWSWADKLRLAHGTTSVEQARRVCEADAECSCEHPSSEGCYEPLWFYRGLHGGSWQASSATGACGRLTAEPVKGGWRLRLRGTSRSGSLLRALADAGWAVAARDVDEMERGDLPGRALRQAHGCPEVLLDPLNPGRHEQGRPARVTGEPRSPNDGAR